MKYSYSVNKIWTLRYTSQIILASFKLFLLFRVPYLKGKNRTLLLRPDCLSVRLSISRLFLISRDSQTVEIITYDVFLLRF